MDMIILRSSGVGGFPGSPCSERQLATRKSPGRPALPQVADVASRLSKQRDKHSRPDLVVGALGHAFGKRLDMMTLVQDRAIPGSHWGKAA
jgi:hypothetical protein